MSLAQSGPEEQALKDMFLANTPAEAEAHLPEAVRKAAQALSLADRARLDSQLLFRNSICRDAKCTLPDDGLTLLRMERSGEDDDRQVSEIRLRKKISDGHDSVLLLQVVENDVVRGGIGVWMELEDGVWRVTEVHPGDRGVAFDANFANNFSQSGLDAFEASAIGSLRTLNTALVTYAATYPDVGFAKDLAALGGNGGDANGAGLIDSVLASGEKSGYRFELHSSGATYEIVARPIRFGETGKRNFFTDETGVIRFTSEDRPATAADRPLQ